MTEFPGPLPDAIEVAIVGAGQAGLSMSRILCGRGVPHVVLERHSPGHAWRSERWDSFCLVTPNWQCRLPDYPYSGDDPDGFMVRAEICDYLDGFLRSFDPPVRSGVEVTALRPNGSGFVLETSRGSLRAGQVVVATGGYHAPIVPDEAHAVSPGILQLDASIYRNAEALPPGAVLVVGSGQSGAQIAEDLHLAGRRVHLCVGSAPKVSRSHRGRDVVAWLDAMGFYDLPVGKHPLGEGVRDNTNHYVTGRDGGRDIDLRAHAATGMRLHGRLVAIGSGGASFADDLVQNLEAAEATNAAIKRSIDTWIEQQGIEAPAAAPYDPPWHPSVDAALEIDFEAEAIGSIVWCIGFSAEFGWIDAPVLDARGRPVHERGATRTPGLYFLGLPWLYSWGSGRFSGVARDAEHLAGMIEVRRTR